MDAVKYTCGSCKNRYIPSRQEPCNLCSLNEFAPKDERGPHNNWEPSIDFVEKKAAEEIAKALPTPTGEGVSYRTAADGSRVAIMRPVQPQAVADNAGGAVKADTGKAPMGLLPRSALVAEAEVLAFGATKYAPHNWRKGMNFSRLGDAAMRHLTAWLDGEDTDPETGLSHLAHLRCCAGFLIEYQKKGLGHDDRHTA